MALIHHLLQDIDERTLAQRIGIPHDEARIRYSLRSNTAGSYDEFSDIIGDYYNHHFTSCVSNGGGLSRSESIGRAREILEREYRRPGSNGDIVTAYNDAHDGVNGGLRLVLDRIAEGIKAESVERYIRDAFDRHVAPNAWEDKVEIIRQFIMACGVHLNSSIRADQPERYAHDFQDLIRSYVRDLERTSRVFRRL